MKYREDKHGNKLSLLGLGCARFSKDMAETERMILVAIEGGINIFDTGYIYSNSEVYLGEALAKNNKRKDVYIVDKLPLYLCKKPEDFDKLFNEQLKRLQTDYFDYYLMHSIMDMAQWEHFRKLGIEDWIAEKRKSGQIRQVGFSYHGPGKDFLLVLDSYDWEYCLIQYSYYDENYQAGKTGLLAAAEKGIPVTIMEPLLGGWLANDLPKQAVELFKNADPNLTPVDWAFRWLWNQNAVTVTFSGMSTVEMVEQNLRFVDNFQPLNNDELAVYSDVVNVFKKAFRVLCTGCNYCMPCPMGVNIPGCFAAYNSSYMQGYAAGLVFYAASNSVITRNPSSPRNCNKCGKCEKVCPQYLPIRRTLKKVAGRLEPLPIRLAFSIARRIMTK